MAGFVTITVNDGGAGSVVVPQSNVQVVIGTCSSGTAGTSITATRSLSTLTSTFGYGPLVEAAALTCQAGGTVLCIRVTSATAGSCKAVQFTGTGTSVITNSVATAYDSYFVVFKVVSGGTIGVAGITFQISLDGGRNYGPVLALGTANTYAIPNTGITLAFAAGTLVAGDIAKYQTIEPLWDTAGVQTALNTLAASVYATTGWGSAHLVGGNTVGGCTGAAATTIQGYLNTWATTSNIYSRFFVSARDVGAPAAWGGTGESESAWMTAIQTDYAAVSAQRITAGAGYWNMPSAFPNVTAWGAPRYRRSISYAAAARQVGIPPQRMLSRVKDGSVSQIVVDTTNDPIDGFVYHDERSNPGLDYLISGSGGRFMSTMTRMKKQGVFISHPLTMAPLGSDFYLMPFGNVMDIGCTITQSVGQNQIDDDIRLNSNGTINDNDAKNIENEIQGQLNAQMLSTGMLSPPGAVVVVSRSQNVATTKIVPITVTLYGKGYILSETVNIGYNNPLVATA